MPFLDLTLRCRESEHPRYEHALEATGALAVNPASAKHRYGVRWC